MLQGVLFRFFFFFPFSRSFLDGSEVKWTRQAQGAPSLSDQSIGRDKEKIVNESYYKIEKKRMEVLCYSWQCSRRVQDRFISSNLTTKGKKLVDKSFDW